MSPDPAPGRLRRVGEAVRSVGGRGYRFASGAEIRARRALHPRGRVPGLLSVVVPVYNVED